jgi:hypothetical protein
MRYRIHFARETVGQARVAPFEIDAPDQLGAGALTADLSRRIRDRVVDALVASPAPGASDARAVIAEHTQVIVMLNAGEGAAYYGVTTLGTFQISPIN